MTAAASGPVAATGTALPASPPAPPAGAVPAPASAPVSSPVSAPDSLSIPDRPHAPDRLRRALGAACRRDEALAPGADRLMQELQIAAALATGKRALLFNATERDGGEEAAGDLAGNVAKAAVTDAGASAGSGDGRTVSAGDRPVTTATITKAATTAITMATAAAQAEAALRRRLAQRASARVPLLVRRAGQSRYPL